MKNISLMFLVILFIFTGCDKENIGQFDDAIVENSSNVYKFKQIWFTINIQSISNGYLSLTKIDSVTLKVNGKPWGTFSSEVIDTTGKTSTMMNNLRYSATEINYLVIAPYQLKTDHLETAGDIVNYMSNRLVLTPGDYVFEISELKFKDISGQWRILKPSVYKDFKVVENTTSSFSGNISIKIK